ncbi:MAG: hypothetical protein PHS59_17255 [Paludibacter sp.]|nr:hypothetical protein [Paludibacter sp.]
MKKKIFGGIAVVAIAVAVAFNVSVVNQRSNYVSNFALVNVEVLALAEPGDFTDTGKSINGENGGNNDFWTSLSQGATKDEWSREWECEVNSTSTSTDPNINASANITVPVYGTPVGVNGGIDSGGTTTVTETRTGGTKIECFDNGTNNCSNKDC